MLMLLLRSLGLLVVMGGILFGPAGRWDLPFFWAVLAIVWGINGVLGVFAVDPKLQEQRGRELQAKDKEVDLMAVVMLPGLLAQWVIASLDAGRFHWSHIMPAAVHVAGLVACAAGFGMSVWAMRINRFFYAAVAVRSEQEHRVITTGPYQYMRHPGYAGLLFGSAGISFALGSWWSLIPFIPVVLVFVRRTAMEDRVLQAELAGYAEYAQKVRFRWLPGIW